MECRIGRHGKLDGGGVFWPKFAENVGGKKGIFRLELHEVSGS